MSDYERIAREALAERAELLQALAEARARCGDVEARLVEAEAVIQKARALVAFWQAARGANVGMEGLRRVLDASASRVLADHDREVAARAWDEGQRSGWGILNAPSENPYRTGEA